MPLIKISFCLHLKMEANMEKSLLRSGIATLLSLRMVYNYLRSSRSGSSVSVYINTFVFIVLELCL